MRLVSISGQVGARLLGVAALLFLIARPLEKSSPQKPPVIEPITDRDLQLVRLFDRTNGIWTPADLAMWQELTFDTNLPETTTAPSIREQVIAQMNAADWEAAQQSIDRLLSDNPGDGQLNFWLALITLPDPAGLPYLEAAARLDSDSQAAAASILGIVQVDGYQPRDVALRLLENNEWALAERFFTLQIEQDNFDAMSFAYRGLARDQQGEDGLADIEMAIALEPGFALPYYMLGLHERQQGRLAKSVDAFSNAYLLDEDNPALAAELAAAYRLNNQMTLAEDWFAEAVDLAPDDPRFAALQANFYAENDYKLNSTALEVLAASASRYPLDADIQASYGYALIYNNNLPAAEETLTAALELAPDSVGIQFYIGSLREKQGNYSEAIRHYLTVAQSENPYSEAARANIARLSQ